MASRPAVVSILRGMGALSRAATQDATRRRYPGRVKILVLGSGAREHAIVLALRADDAGHDILVAPGNAGLARDATLVDVDMMDPHAVTEFAQSEAVDLVVVGPEAPLVAGVADALRE